VQARGEAGISNAGAIVGPHGVTIVDTLATAPMARSFSTQLRRRTDLPVERTLFTHHHIDHVIGAQFLSRSPIIAHERCRDAMAESGVDAHRRWALRRPQFAERDWKPACAQPGPNATNGSKRTSSAAMPNSAAN
jgi:glyoxylase-like metal-dependent hydrolase (beta-lactamase superfamily II)